MNPLIRTALTSLTSLTLEKTLNNRKLKITNQTKKKTNGKMLTQTYDCKLINIELIAF